MQNIVQYLSVKLIAGENAPPKTPQLLQKLIEGTQKNSRKPYDWELSVSRSAHLHFHAVWCEVNAIFTQWTAEKKHLTFLTVWNHSSGE